MLEYPESYTIARQMRESILGKTVVSGEYVHPNANIFNPEGAPERYGKLAGGKVTEVVYHAPDLYVRLDNGYGILFRQGGGKILYHEAASDGAPKYNFRFAFSDGGSLTYSVLLWSYGVDAIAHEAWSARTQSMDEGSFQPMDGSLADYLDFVKSHMDDPKQAVKTYLTKKIGGIMSTFAGEILLHAKVHPSVHIGKLDDDARTRIYHAMRDVLERACKAGGRTSEFDLYGNRGGYQAMSERKHIGEPCPLCGDPLEKVSVGGVIAFCPRCQKK